MTIGELTEIDFCAPFKELKDPVRFFSVTASSDPGKGNLTIAYGRDGGEEAAFPVQNFPSLEEYHRIGLDQLSADYLYLYDDGRWLVYGLYNDPDWIEMQVIIGKEQ